MVLSILSVVRESCEGKQWMGETVRRLEEHFTGMSILDNTCTYVGAFESTGQHLGKT